MSGNQNNSDVNIWRTGYAFALLLLFMLGVSFIVIGTGLFENGSLLNVIFIGTGISMAPAAIVASFFRYFLFKEVQYQLKQPVIDEIKQHLGPEISEQVDSIISEYRKEIVILRSLKDAGAIRPYRRREIALREFASSIDAETNEILVVGSSLKGLIQLDKYKEIKEKLRFKIERGGVRVKFLLTHPVVADLRASQEARKFTEIGGEIIDSLLTLKEWNISPENVRLYKGTPTCFAIKTGRKMLLNPYPYGKVAFDSPCLIVETSDMHPGYFFDEFDKSHFTAWDTNVAARILNIDDTVRELRANLPKYAEVVSRMLGLNSVGQDPTSA